MARTHHLPAEQVHFTWDTRNEPRVVVDSSDTVVVLTRDVSDNQIGPDSDVRVIAGLDRERVYPLIGPIGIHGAEPGDTLAIEVPRHSYPGMGLDGDPARAGSPARGLPGRLSADLRPLTRRRRVHAGGHRDPARAVLRDAAPLTSRVDSAPFYGTTGIGGDLYVAAQDAVRAMVDHIEATYDLGREDVYLLCSLAVDLKVSEIVDAGQYVVSALLPEAIFG